MGAYLDRPLTEKDSSDGSIGSLGFGSSAMQGWRCNMEDAHINTLEFEGEPDCALFAVFDGHGGQEVASFCKDKFGEVLLSLDEYKEGSFMEAMRKGFLQMDKDILASWPQSLMPYQAQNGRGDRFVDSTPYQETCPGCTAVACLLKGNKCYIANAGDSRIVLCRNGQAIELSEDHKPELAEERSRIEKAGGYISDGRVNGNLNLTRAIGDFAYKRDDKIPPEAQIITANPDVFSREFGPGDEFLILGCDGVWDRKTSQEVVDFVREAWSKADGHTKLSRLVEALLDDILSPNMQETDGLGCDNMTCVLVDLQADRRGPRRPEDAGEPREEGKHNVQAQPGIQRRPTTVVGLEKPPEGA